MSKIISNLKQSKVGNQARRIYIKAISRRHFKSVIKNKRIQKTEKIRFASYVIFDSTFGADDLVNIMLSKKRDMGC